MMVLAICLAILDSSDIEHGDLEFLFTVDEETGLVGASQLQEDFLKGRRLINLDSDEFGTLRIGCAGGGKSIISLPIKTRREESVDLVRIDISGLQGGHSGVDIDKGRGNSIKILGRVLWRLDQDLDGEILIKNVSGGNKDNAIPRESEAAIALGGSVKKARDTILEEFDKARNEYRETEQYMDLNIETETKKRIDLLTPESSKKTICLIKALPNGLLSMSQKIPNLVKTSTNLAKISKKPQQVVMRMVTRSNTMTELEATRDQIRAIANLADADVEENQPYPGWEPDRDSELLEILSKSFKKMFGSEPEAKTIHAGLEPGIIGEKYPDMDMISLGPEVNNPHSPDEKVDIESVQKLWNYLVKSLEKLSK